MIYIERDATNSFALEVQNLIPSDHVYFLLGILWEGEIDKEWRAIVLEDESPASCRYNLFTIEESTSGTEDLWIPLTLPVTPIKLELGQYKYYVWTSSEPFEEPVGWDGSTQPINSKPITNGRMIVVGEIEAPYDSIITDVSLPSVYE
jgi:hypothetical protein